MRTILAFATAAILASTALHAQTADRKAERAATGVPAQRALGHVGRSFMSCAYGPRDTQLFDLRAAQASQRKTVPDLKVVVDFNKGVATGSLVLPPVELYSECPPPRRLECGKLKVEEGRTQGRTFAFTTYRTIDGVRIPTRWEGEALSTGGLSYRSIDPVPCPVPDLLVSSNGLIPPATPVGSSFVFRQGARSKDPKAAGPASATGKWWTIDGRRVVILDLKAGSKGQLSGSVNVCSGGDNAVRGRTDRKIEKGSIVGKNISFETAGFGLGGIAGPMAGGPAAGRLQMRGVPAAEQLQWTGELADDGTISLSKPFTGDPCGFTAAVSLTLRQP